MTSGLIRPHALGCLAVLVALLWAAPTGSVRAQAPDVGTEAQRESGKRLYAKYCSQCHGEKGDGEGYATPAPVPQAPGLHDGQIQNPDDAERGAADASGPRQHHQARHALHLDARLAGPVRPGSVGSRLLPYNLLRPTSRAPRMSRSPYRSRARRALRMNPSRSAKSSTRRAAASSATARSVGATDLRLQP